MGRIYVSLVSLFLVTAPAFAAPVGQAQELSSRLDVVLIATVDQVNAKMASCRKSLGPLFMGVEVMKSVKLVCIKAKDAAGALRIEKSGKSSCDGEGRAYLGALDDKGSISWICGQKE